MRSIELSGKSQSTLVNYGRCLAHLALHFNCNILELDQEQLLDYLHHLKSLGKTPSDSFFKHTVYGLRYLYRQYGIPEHRAVLPSIERPKKLPVVLSQKEVICLLKAPKLLKHRVMLALLYGCGLRNFELRNLHITDLDLDRLQLHVRQGKGRKDRYVPLCDLLVRGLQEYLAVERPVKWLFNGHNAQGEAVPLSANGVQWAIREAKRYGEIPKQVTAHTLRHSYATHLLEMGMDIMTLKDLLGHVEVQTTLVYLHVSRLEGKKAFSPLERLYAKQK